MTGSRPRAGRPRRPARPAALPAPPPDMPERVLTGITTTGTPHLGNYVGAIRPAIGAPAASPASRASTSSPTTTRSSSATSPARIQRSTLEIAATWLACGLDAEPRHLLPPVRHPRDSRADLAAHLRHRRRALLNRAHAYKAASDKNVAAGEDDGRRRHDGPLQLPGADGRRHPDVQRPPGAGRPRPGAAHRDGARHRAALQPPVRRAGERPSCCPSARSTTSVATLPGLDGRKMSKSYDNTIPLFAAGARQLRKAMSRIVTDSRAPGEPKDAEGSALFADPRRLRRGRRSARGVPRRAARRPRLGRGEVAAVRAGRVARWRRCASATRR